MENFELVEPESRGEVLEPIQDQPELWMELDCSGEWDEGGEA